MGTPDSITPNTCAYRYGGGPYVSLSTFAKAHYFAYSFDAGNQPWATILGTISSVLLVENRAGSSFPRGHGVVAPVPPSRTWAVL